MVRNYIKKTNQADISEESIVLALNDNRNGNYRSIREAAEAHGLIKSTLHFRLKKIRRKERTDDPNNEGRADELNNEDGVDEHILNENEIEDEPQPIKEVTTADMAFVYHSKFTHRQAFTYEKEQKLQTTVLKGQE